MGIVYLHNLSILVGLVVAGCHHIRITNVYLVICTYVAGDECVPAINTESDLWVCRQ